MLISTRTRADDVRALAGAIVLGSSAGLVIGAAYLAGSGAKPAARPAPAVSGPLQATASPSHPGVVRAEAQAPPRVAVPQPQAVAVELGQVLRDRFRVAVGSAQGAARPFRFQQVADAPSDLHCLTEAVYFEARGEAAAGQQAVAQVVLNRVRHPAYPKTICAVVHQHTGSGCQFSFACGSRQAAVTSVAWRRAESIAASEMHGAVMTAVGDATAFQAAHASPFAGLLKVAQVGAHIFYRFGGHAGAPAMFHQTPAASSPPANIQVARLEPAPASKAVQPVQADGRIRVTLYPGPAAPAAALASAKPEAAAVKLANTAAPEPRSPTPSPAHDGPAPAATPPVKAAEAPGAKPAIISVALAQS